MIDALIGGKLFGRPTRRVGPSGKPFVTCKVRTSVSDGESVFVNVICFERSVIEPLLALDDGDSVALSGSLTPKVWSPSNGGSPRAGLDLVAGAIITSYHVKRKRETVQGKVADSDRGQSYRDAYLPLPDK